jgi:glycosyltransferase involved in cell wall biosynthesis
VSYKQVRLLVEAFNRLQLPLVIIGGGPDFPSLKRLANSNIQLLGPQPNAVVEEYMAQAKAFVYAACEDFGIALVEAQACGTPVIAYGRGGALETVRDWRHDPEQGTGLHFPRQEIADIVETVHLFAEIHSKLNPESCRQQAQRFAPSEFTTSYLNCLEQCERDWREQLHQRPLQFCS